MKRSVIVLLHIGYWILYLLLVSSFIWAVPGGDKDRSFATLGRILFLSPITLLILFPGVAGFYSFYSFLFSRFLNRKKLIALSVSGLLISFVLAIFFLSLTSVLGFSKAHTNREWGDLLAEGVFLSALILVHGTIALIMRGFITWYAEIKLKEDLDRKNYETELALVKSQVNPHFLFNTINNIDVLIQKDPDKASAYLNKLSDIMRFMLYETKTELIPLSKELAYIEKYIDLQKIRTSNPGYINYSKEGEPANLLIAPMLFIPFIENAFKYAENKQMQNAIRIEINITGDQLIFTCVNIYRDSPRDLLHGGLGNELIHKRLMLLYPGKHTLEITDQSSVYNVKLVLSFHEN